MVILWGDTHGDIEINKIGPRKQYSENDVIIVLGDWGIPFYSYADMDKYKCRRNYEYWCKWLSEFPCDILFVDGNHDNHDFWAEVPKVFSEKYGNLVQAHPDIPNCYHLLRGGIYTIQGHKILTFGGAHSRDKEFRVEGVTWWAGEDATEEDWKFYEENIARHREECGNKVDYILSHTAPRQIMLSHNYMEPDVTSSYLQQIMNDVEYKEWYCGHFHIDHSLSPGDKVYCLYKKPMLIEAK